MYIFLSLITGILLGGLLYKKMYEFSENEKKRKAIIKINNKFQQLLSNVSLGRSAFKNRVNNIVFIRTTLDGHGDVDIIYMMDNRDIAVFKEDKCIYTSESASKDVISDITNTIDIRFKTQINDVVDILGFKFYREEFEKTFNIDMDQIKKQLGMEESDLDKIQSENNAKFDIDEILDKINKNGMNSLTFEERVFLDNYSKNS